MGCLRSGSRDHLEGMRERASGGKCLVKLRELVRLADELGVEYAWFAEHHAHAHCGHLPTPLLFALHLAGQTKWIQLGTAIVCLNSAQSAGCGGANGGGGCAVRRAGWAPGFEAEARRRSVNYSAWRMCRKRSGMRDLRNHCESSAIHGVAGCCQCRRGILRSDVGRR